MMEKVPKMRRPKVLTEHNHAYKNTHESAVGHNAYAVRWVLFEKRKASQSAFFQFARGFFVVILKIRIFVPVHHAIMDIGYFRLILMPTVKHARLSPFDEVRIFFYR